tara:strand:+ start:460 stop:852 length:393 start_codon:yes stop_codon:yes gene_type:complete
MAWYYEGRVITELSDIPEGSIGFIYKITNKETRQFYIGKKSLYSHRTLPPLKGYKRKRKVIKESKWKDYGSSNKEVQGWLEVHKQILRFCSTKKALTYYELKEQFRHDCLELEECLNDNLLGKFFKKDLE